MRPRTASPSRTGALALVIGLVSALALAIPAAPVQAQAGDDQAAAMRILRKAADRYREVDTVCAEFHQILTVTLLGQRSESRGELCQRRPNLFAMRFTVPAGDAVVADGSHFWIYYASVNPDQVLRVPLDPARGGLDFYREFLEEPEAKYDVVLEGEDTVTGRPTARLALEPRANRGYDRARVWIDRERGMIRKVEIHEANGTVRVVELDEIRVDPPLGPDAFTFRVPDGVTVIRR